MSENWRVGVSVSMLMMMLVHQQKWLPLHDLVLSRIQFCLWRYRFLWLRFPIVVVRKSMFVSLKDDDGDVSVCGLAVSLVSCMTASRGFDVRPPSLVPIPSQRKVFVVTFDTSLSLH